MPLLDAFAHVSLPRFIGAEELLRIMDDNGVEMAMVTTADTCPDVQELSDAIVHDSLTHIRVHRRVHLVARTRLPRRSATLLQGA